MFIRSACERDLAAIRELLVATWHATYDDIYGERQVDEITNDWHSIAALKARLLRPNSEFLVADDGKQIGGMAFAAATSDQKTVILQQLYVLPDHQRAGIGHMLLSEIESCFPDAQLVRLEVEAANAPALAFYHKHGFVHSGVIGNCGPEDTDIPALVLEKKLG